ncbi:Beta-lactamase class A [Caldanaerobius fijiensis DSM 17918]|uniref:Beta-lactamase class A n=1 Tax=Caldanaerobius fijiensis DSM 17918 TaxID=1121256 RepID=A0A1M5CIK2_9THEO|nr:serine hydrolase [Caldanaerobius fijiensis]SHF54605.1 Beta-lactamase class A [Caldanaerobius fijiensis DSM 17918]
MKEKRFYRIIASFVLIMAIIAITLPASANYPDISLYINGILVQINPKPVVIGGYIAVPFRGISEALGADVYWDLSTQTMTAVKGNQNVTVQSGHKWAIVNGKVITMPVYSFMNNNRLYVPLTLFKEAFGANIQWDKVNHIAYVTTPDSHYEWGTGISNISYPDYSALKAKLQRYINTRPGQISVYVHDLTTGQTLSIGGDRVYAAASTIKLPLVLYLYEQAAAGKVDLNTKLTYTPQYYMQGTGILQGQPFGGQYTIRELSRLAIEYSDNVAWQMLLDYAGQDNLTAFEKSLGAKATGLVNGLSVTTPKDMDIYLSELLTFRDENYDLGNEVLYYMEHSIFSEGIPQELPSGVVVAHKMGALDDKFHDVGIVFGNRPYIITIFTENGWEDASLQTLADISRIVYDYQSGL